MHKVLQDRSGLIMEKKIMTTNVKKEWVDYNDHMNDAEYARVFSMAVDTWMGQLGIDQAFIQAEHYTIFTLETHICYLREANLDEPLTVHLQLLDHDEKRLHVFFVLENADGDRVATSEQMLMGMDTEAGRPGAFPEVIAAEIATIAKEQESMEAPKEAGRTIGIRRK